MRDVFEEWDDYQRDNDIGSDVNLGMSTDFSGNKDQFSPDSYEPINPEQLQAQKYQTLPETFTEEEREGLQKRMDKSLEGLDGDYSFWEGVKSSTSRGSIMMSLQDEIAQAQDAGDTDGATALSKFADEYSAKFQAEIDKGNPNAFEKTMQDLGGTMPYMMKIAIPRQISATAAYFGGKAGAKVIAGTAAEKAVAGTMGKIASTALAREGGEWVAKKGIGGLLGKAFAKAAVRYAVSDAALTPAQLAAGATGAGAIPAVVAEGVQHLVIGAMFLWDVIAITKSLTKDEETGLIGLKKDSKFGLSPIGAGMRAVIKPMQGAMYQNIARLGPEYAEKASPEVMRGAALLSASIESVFNPFALPAGTAVTGAGKALGAINGRVFGKMMVEGAVAKGIKTTLLLGGKAAGALVARGAPEAMEEGGQAVVERLYTSKILQDVLERHPELATAAALNEEVTALANSTVRDYVNEYVEQTVAAIPVSLCFGAMGMPGYMMGVARDMKYDEMTKLSEEAKKASDQLVEGKTNEQAILDTRTAIEALETKYQGKAAGQWEKEDLLTYRAYAETLEALGEKEGSDADVKVGADIIAQVNRSIAQGEFFDFLDEGGNLGPEADKEVMEAAISLFLTGDRVHKVIGEDIQVDKKKADKLFKAFNEWREASGQEKYDSKKQFYSRIFGPNYELSGPVYGGVDAEASVPVVEKAIADLNKTETFELAKLQKIQEALAGVGIEVKKANKQQMLDAANGHIEAQKQQAEEAEQQKAAEAKTEAERVASEKQGKAYQAVAEIDLGEDAENMTLGFFKSEHYDKLLEEVRSEVSVEEAFAIAKGEVSADVEVRESERFVFNGKEGNLTKKQVVDGIKAGGINKTNAKALAKRAMDTLGNKEGNAVLVEIFGEEAGINQSATPVENMEMLIENGVAGKVRKYQPGKKPKPQKAKANPNAAQKPSVDAAVIAREKEIYAELTAESNGQTEQAKAARAILNSELAAEELDVTFAEYREKYPKSPSENQAEVAPVAPEGGVDLSQTKVVDGQGQPLTVYHGSGDAEGGIRLRSGLGIHFGTAEQANARLDALSISTAKPQNPQVLPAKINLKNPLRTDDWHFDDAYLTLGHLHADEKVFTGAERRAITEKLDSLSEKGLSTDSPEMLAVVRNALIEKGYDGIVYENEIEGRGDSYIVFNEKDIFPLFASTEAPAPVASKKSASSVDKDIDKTKPATEEDILKEIQNRTSAEDFAIIGGKRSGVAVNTRLDKKYASDEDIGTIAEDISYLTAMTETSDENIHPLIIFDEGDEYGLFVHVAGNQIISGIPREFLDENGHLQENAAFRFVMTKGKRQVFGDKYGNDIRYANDLVALQVYWKDSKSAPAFNVAAFTEGVEGRENSYLVKIVPESGVIKAYDTSVVGHQNKDLYVPFDLKKLELEMSLARSAAGLSESVKIREKTKAQAKDRSVLPTDITAAKKPFASEASAKRHMTKNMSEDERSGYYITQLGPKEFVIRKKGGNAQVSDIGKGKENAPYDTFAKAWVRYKGKKTVPWRDTHYIQMLDDGTYVLRPYPVENTNPFLDAETFRHEDGESSNVAQFALKVWRGADWLKREYEKVFGEDVLAERDEFATKGNASSLLSQVIKDDLFKVYRGGSASPLIKFLLPGYERPTVGELRSYVSKAIKVKAFTAVNDVSEDQMVPKQMDKIRSMTQDSRKDATAQMRQLLDSPKPLVVDSMVQQDGDILQGEKPFVNKGLAQAMMRRRGLEKTHYIQSLKTKADGKDQYVIRPQAPRQMSVLADFIETITDSYGMTKDQRQAFYEGNIAARKETQLYKSISEALDILEMSDRDALARLKELFGRKDPKAKDAQRGFGAMVEQVKRRGSFEQPGNFRPRNLKVTNGVVKFSDSAEAFDVLMKSFADENETGIDVFGLKNNPPTEEQVTAAAEIYMIKARLEREQSAEKPDTKVIDALNSKLSELSEGLSENIINAVDWQISKLKETASAYATTRRVIPHVLSIATDKEGPFADKQDEGMRVDLRNGKPIAPRPFDEQNDESVSVEETLSGYAPSETGELPDVGELWNTDAGKARRSRVVKYVDAVIPRLQEALKSNQRALESAKTASKRELFKNAVLSVEKEIRQLERRRLVATQEFNPVKSGAITEAEAERLLKDFVIGGFESREHLEGVLGEELGRFGLKYRAEGGGWVAFGKDGKDALVIEYRPGGIILKDSEKSAAGFFETRATELDLLAVAGIGGNNVTFRHELLHWAWRNRLSASDKMTLLSRYKSEEAWVKAMENYTAPKQHDRVTIIVNSVVNFFRRLINKEARKVADFAALTRQADRINEMVMNGAYQDRQVEGVEARAKGRKTLFDPEKLQAMSRDQLDAAFRSYKRMMAEAGIDIKIEESAPSKRIIRQMVRKDMMVRYALNNLMSGSDGKAIARAWTMGITKGNFGLDSIMSALAPHDPTGIIQETMDDLKRAQTERVAPIAAGMASVMEGVIPLEVAKQKFTVNFGGQSVTLTGSELATFRVAMENKNWLKSLTESGNKVAFRRGLQLDKDVEEFTVTAEDLQAIKGMLPNEQQLLDQWREFSRIGREESLPVINELIKNPRNFTGITKENLGDFNEEYYFPLSTLEGEAERAEMKNSLRKNTSWAHKTTGKKGKTLVLSDIYSVAKSHSDNVGELAGMALETQRVIDLLVRKDSITNFKEDLRADSPLFKNKMATKLEKKLHTAISQMVNPYAQGDEVVRHPVFRHLKQGQDIFRLTNIWTMAKMASSSHLILPFLNSRSSYAAALKTPKINEITEPHFRNNAYMWMRGETAVSISAGDTMTAASGRAVLGGEKTLADSARSFVGKADRLAMRTIFLATAYDNLPAGTPKTLKSLQSVKNPAEFWADVQQKANRLVMETQPTSESYMRGEWQNKRTLLSTMLTRYSTQTNRMANMLFKSYTAYRAGEDPQAATKLLKTSTSVLLANAFVLSMIGASRKYAQELMKRVAGGDPEDEEDKKMYYAGELKTPNLSKLLGKGAVSSLAGLIQGGDEALLAFEVMAGNLTGEGEYKKQWLMQKPMFMSEVAASIDTLKYAGRLARQIKKRDDAQMRKDHKDYMDAKRSISYASEKLYESTLQVIGVLGHFPTKMFDNAGVKQKIRKATFKGGALDELEY